MEEHTKFIFYFLNFMEEHMKVVLHRGLTCLEEG